MSGYSEQMPVELATVTEMLLTETLDEALGRIGRLAVATVPSCDACGSTLAEDGSITQTVASGQVAKEADDFQDRTCEGPCVHAIRTGEITNISFLEGELRWPGFDGARPRPPPDELAVAAAAGQRHLGRALHLYSTTGQLQSDEELANAFAGQAAVTLANARMYAKARDLVDHLNLALESRDVIGQAKGIIMVGRRCTADEAFALLRSMSQRENTKLRDVAQQVADTGTWDQRW